MSVTSTIFLDRAYLPDGSGTFGLWCMPDGFKAYTLEPPWKANEPYASCIPEGVYDLVSQPSSVVYNTTSADYTEGWFIQNVPDRAGIVAHIGNFIEDTEGCPLIGSGFGWHPQKGPAVVASREAFYQLMGRMRERDAWRIDVRPKLVSYP